MDSSSNAFHLAIDGGDLSVTVPFYTDILECGLGKDAEPGCYQDIDFWGNELTLHESDPVVNNTYKYHTVDMGSVPVPHLGIHVDIDTWCHLTEKFTNDHQEYMILKPFTRYVGTPTEQRTFFVRDPNYNVIEIKYYQ